MYKILTIKAWAAERDNNTVSQWMADWTKIHLEQASKGLVYPLANDIISITPLENGETMDGSKRIKFTIDFVKEFNKI